MMLLYDEEEIMKSYVESERYEERIETAKEHSCNSEITPME